MREAARINAVLWMAEMRQGAAEMVAREGDRDAQFVFARMVQDAGESGLSDLMKALQARTGVMRAWEMALRDTPVILTPVSGELPFDQQLDVRSEADFARVYEAQLTQRALPVIGQPGLAVATGQAGDRPVGVQLIAPRFREDILLAAGRAIEAEGPPVTVATPDW
jgi:amidase